MDAARHGGISPRGARVGLPSSTGQCDRRSAPTPGGAYAYPFQGALVSNPRPYYPWGFAPQGGEAAMIDEILQKFLDKKPIAVIVGATIARTIGDSVLDDIFERHADGQYTRELTFS